MPLELQFQAPHREAAAFLRGKPALARQVWEQLLPEVRARAFTVTGIEAANVLERLRDEIASLPEGKTWDQVKESVVDALTPYLGDGAERRAELLLRTHGFQAFQASTWRAAQLDEDTTHLQYLTMEDERVRDSHRALDGVILPKDDPFWDTHTPPWDWGCRCRIRPLNSEQVELARRLDERRPPEARLVLEGPVLDQLRHGARITPDGQRVDVTPPSQRPGAERAFGWNPRDLELSLEQLRERFDPETWAVFSRWAADTEIAEGVTVYQWLSQPAVLSRAPAALETWRRLGRPEVRAWPGAPLAEMDAALARRRIEAGVSVIAPTGQVVHFTASLLHHWELEAGKAAGDIQRRLQLLPAAWAAVQQPEEIWDQGRVRVYLRRAGQDYVVAVFTPAGGEVRTYFITRKIQWVDRIRKGVLIWPKTER